MSVGTFHTRHVLGRRARVLASQLARLVPHKVEVLDVGCGDGQIARGILAQRPDISLTGVDVLVRPMPAIPVLKFDGRTLPCPDASKDVVMFVDVLHHATDPLSLLSEAVRVSRRWLLIKDHNRQGLAAGATLRFMDWVGNAHHGVALPYNYWQPAEWENAFGTLGLRRVRTITDIGLYPAWADWIFGRGLHFITLLEKTSA